MNLENATAIVTGASTGIGRAIAKAIAAKGGRVGLVGRNLHGLEQTQAEISALGGESHIFVADLQDEEAITKLAAEVKQLWQRVDILANIAGVWHDEKRTYYGHPLEEISVAEIDETLDINLRAPLLLARLFLPEMKQQKRGKILNVSADMRGHASDATGWVHQHVAKLAVEMFTTCLADEVRNHQIQVNCLAPHFVASEAVQKFFPEFVETAIPTDVVAQAAMFLLANEAADNITGQILYLRSKDNLKAELAGS
ncbi:MAG: SDR family oxidoreductase [Caldilineaceae bacterium]